MWIKDNQQDISKRVFQHTYPKIADFLVDKDLNHLSKEHQLFVFPDTIATAVGLEASDKIFETVNEQLRTRNLVGFIGVDGETVYIHSRFTKEGGEDYFLHYMLERVLHLNLTNLDSSLSLEHQFHQLLIYVFPSYLQAALRKGLYKEYRRRDHQDANIKGPLNVARHIKSSLPFRGNISYTSREFSYDNDLLQLVRHTIEFIKSNQRQTVFHLRDRANVEAVVRETPSYQIGDRARVIFRNQRRPIRHAYFHDYASLQKICLHILKDEKQAFGNTQERVHGILFDVAWLWEEYLATLLKTIFVHPQNKAKSGGFSLFNGGNGRIYPDFLHLSGPTAIADAKYKPLGNIKGADYLQLLAYMYRFDAQLGLYLFPDVENARNTDPFELLQGRREKREKKVLVKKLGLEIPQESVHFEEFQTQMKKNEQAFINSIQDLLR